jgi:hypothetical protein
MSLKKELLDKVPIHLQGEDEFKTLLEYIEKEGLEEKHKLLEFLRKEMESVEEWLAENKEEGGTMVKEIRDKAVKLGVLKKCERMVMDFLI